MSSRKQRSRLWAERRIAHDTLVEEGRKDAYLNGLTKADLIQYAEANGIKVDKTAKKADILEKIKE